MNQYKENVQITLSRNSKNYETDFTEIILYIFFIYSIA